MTYDQLIAHYKTQSAAAAALKVAQSSVAEWKEKGVPPLRQLQAEKESKGKIKADPDVFSKPGARAREARA